MDLAAVMDALATRLETITGLRVFGYPAPNVVPPAGMVGWPSQIDYDLAMARGAWQVALPVLVAVGKADLRSSRDAIAGYLAGSGSSSIRAALDGATAAYDSARVTNAHVEPVSISGTEYLAAILDVEVTGH